MIIPTITTPEITHTWRSILTGSGLAAMLADIRYRNVRYLSNLLQGVRTLV